MDLRSVLIGELLSFSCRTDSEWKPVREKCGEPKQMLGGPEAHRHNMGSARWDTLLLKHPEAGTNQLRKGAIHQPVVVVLFPEA